MTKFNAIILSKYYLKTYHDFKRFIVKLFMEYSKNKPIQKVNPKGVGVAHVSANVLRKPNLGSIV